jgi:hypothetical protein
MNDNIAICKRCNKGFKHNGRRRVYCSQACYMEILKEPMVKPDTQYLDTAIKVMIILLGLFITVSTIIFVTCFYNKPSVEEQLEKKFEVYLDNYFRD